MAIAFDSTGNGSGTSISVTNTAGDFMFVAMSINALSATVSCTYNGVSMTATGATAVDSSFYQLYSFTLIAPATGTHTLAITTSAGSVSDMHFVTYSGTKQSGQPDNKSGTSNGSGTTIVGTLTTVADNCWTAMYVLSDQPSPSAGSGSTLRGSVISSAFAVFDSNGVIHPAGSHSMTVNTGSGSSGAIIISIAPAASGTVYTLTTAPASFSYTPKSTGEYRILTMVGAVRSFALTGISVTLSRGKQFLMVTSVASYILTGMKAGITATIHSIWTQKVVSAVSWTIKTITPTNWTGKNQGQ